MTSVVDDDLLWWFARNKKCTPTKILFLQGHFFVQTSNLKVNIHIVPSQFVKNIYFFALQGSVATLFWFSLV